MLPTWYQYSLNFVEYCMWTSVNWLKNCLLGMIEIWIPLVDLVFKPSLLHWSSNKLLTLVFFKPMKCRCCSVKYFIQQWQTDLRIFMRKELLQESLRKKCPYFGVILVCIFSHSDWIQCKCRKIRTNIASNTETFYVVILCIILFS